MEKIKVSRFEYAIGCVAESGYSETHEPYTEAEENQQRREKIENTMRQLKPITTKQQSNGNS